MTWLHGTQPLIMRLASLLLACAWRLVGSAAWRLHATGFARILQLSLQAALLFQQPRTRLVGAPCAPQCPRTPRRCRRLQRRHHGVPGFGFIF
jgi:hypothetical protein